MLIINIDYIGKILPINFQCACAWRMDLMRQFNEIKPLNDRTEIKMTKKRRKKSTKFDSTENPSIEF